MTLKTPENMARAVVEACADCDICRHLMEGTPCLVFPELYRLYDKEAKKKGSVTPEELRNLVELCNFCGLCPCPDVRTDLMKAKGAFIEREGLKPTLRLLQDVERLAAICGTFPALTNALLKNDRVGRLLKRTAGIHVERTIPPVPEENFVHWAQRQGLHSRREIQGRKVAFFAGCTGQYLFPEVPKAVVEVFRQNDIGVYCPPQRCCGMPSLLEGDREFTLQLAAHNLKHLAESVEEGYDIVCACPTCGFMLKSVLSEGACHALQNRPGSGGAGSGRTETGTAAMCGPTGPGVSFPNKPVFQGLFKDEGYFSSLDPERRIQVATHTFDLGEYLLGLQRKGDLNEEFGPVAGRMVYYAPCHLREQKIGRPWVELLTGVPGISLEVIDNSFYCCGMGGIMGFKEAFHETCLRMGHPLMETIRALQPERLLTDCLSCRLQFNQATPYSVFHPVEILREAYRNRRNGSTGKTGRL